MLLWALDTPGMVSTTPLTLALVLNGALAAALAAFAWPRRHVPGARPFMLLNVFAAAACWAYAAHFQGADAATREFWIKARFTAQSGLPLAVILLCFELSDRAAILTRRMTIALAAVPAVVVVSVWTNGWHHLVLKPSVASGSPAVMFGRDPGPVFWLFIAYCFVCIIVGLLTLLDHALRRGGLARMQALLVVTGVAVPFVATILSLLLSAGGGLLLGPFAYAVSLSAFGLAIFRLGFLDIVPIARAAVFEEMSEGVIVFDEAHRVVDANRAAARFLGLSGSLVRKNADDVLDGWPALLDGLRARSRVRAEAQRGEYSLEAVVTPLSSAASAPGHVVLIHDVTDARRTEAALQEASRARGEFLARMSHEIRTPMNGVMGLSGLLLQTSLDERQREYARGVRQSAQALLRVVNDVLDFSRIDAGRLNLEVSNFEPRTTVAEAVNLVRPDAQAKGLTLRIDTDGDVPFTVAGDAGRLRQVLINLLGNAVKFTAAGDVRVRVGSEPAGDDDVLLRIAVSDTGIGIPPAALERIFQPFVQADASTASRYGGSGLGLAICRQLVELMGGSIQARSDVGRGSVFEFTVRVARPRPMTTPIMVEPVDETPAERRWSGRVLVAEDNPVNQLVIVRHLEARGVMADVAASGVEAVDAWSRVPYDLILMDCRMPEMDGYEATREIRRREKGARRTPIVAMTADALPEYRQRSLDAGMDDHVPKPVGTRELEAVLTRYVPPVESAPAIHEDALRDLRAAMGREFDTVVSRYLDDAATSLQTLRTAAAEGDNDVVAHVAHRLKGSSGIVAAATVASLCQRLVDDPRAAGGTLDELDRELDRVREQLQPSAGRR